MLSKLIILRELTKTSLLMKIDEMIKAIMLSKLTD